MIQAKEKQAHKILSLAMDLGKSMIKCGSEISRVEETIMRICYAYGMKQTEVFSVISMIHVTTVDEDGTPYTQSRRVYSNSNNLGKLEKLNALSRNVCAGVCDLDEARKELEKINYEPSPFHVTAMIGSMLAAAGFTVFFGGTLLDAVASVPIACVVYLMSTLIRTRGMNRLFYTALCSVVAGTLAIVFTKIGFGNNPDLIMIGDIMLIIPGVMLINSVREMLGGDIMSGLLRLLEAVIIAMSIACGFAVPILIFGKLGW